LLAIDPSVQAGSTIQSTVGPTSSDARFFTSS